MTTYSPSQTLINVGDALVINTNGATSLSAAVTGTNAGATIIVEGSNDGTNWTTLNTITTASTVAVAFGVYSLVRARLSVAGSGFFVVTLNAVLVAQGFTIQGQSADVAVSPTNSASAYSAGNVVGGKLTFANVFGPAFTGRLCDILVKCKSVQTTGYKLYLFSQNPTNSTWTDKAAPAINAADIPFLLGVFTLGSSDSGLGTETTNQLDNINAIVRSVDQNLYGILTCVATPTYGSTTDLTVSVRVRKD